MLAASGSSALLADDPLAKPITEEERSQVVQQLTEAVHTKDLQKFESLVDEEAYVSFAAKRYQVPDQVIDDLLKASKALKSLTIHYKIALRAYSANGAYDFLKALPASDQLPDRLVFRILDRNGVPSYQTPSGRFRGSHSAVGAVRQRFPRIPRQIPEVHRRIFSLQKVGGRKSMAGPTQNCEAVGFDWTFGGQS